MEFAETEEQGMIREMVRAFAEEELAPTCLDRDRDQRAPLEEWASFCENTGLQGITIPDEFGGSPVDDITEAIIVEELARVDPSFSVMFCVHVGLCSKTIALHGNDEQKKKYWAMLNDDGEPKPRGLPDEHAGARWLGRMTAWVELGQEISDQEFPEE